MTEKRNVTALARAVETLEGARVVEAGISADGSLYVELAHRGTDDDACTLSVEPDCIWFKDVTGLG